MTHPTPEQLDALDVFRAENGPDWKLKLLDGWKKAKYPGHLQALRNQFGPAWLIPYKPGDTRVGRLVKVPNTGLRARYRYHWEVQGTDGGRILNYLGKDDAIAGAATHRITLLEEI